MAKSASISGDITSSHHHVRPKVRGGKDPRFEDLFVFPGDEGQLKPRKHIAWHTLFRLWTLPETRITLVLRKRPDWELDKAFSGKTMRTAWTELFGERATPEDAQRWIIGAFNRDDPDRHQRHREAQLCGRTVDEFLTGISSALRVVRDSEVIGELRFQRAREEFLKRNSWHFLFFPWRPLEVYVTLELWKRGDGSLNSDFLKRGMIGAWRHSFGPSKGTFASPAQAQARIVSLFGSSYLNEQLDLMLAGRNTPRLLDEIRREALQE